MHPYPSSLLDPTKHHKIGLLGLPFDHNSSFLRGPAKAPDLIRKAWYSESANLWSELNVEINKTVVYDAGNLPTGRDAEFHAQIKQGVAGLLEKGLKPFCLGGDHAVTYPVMDAVAEVFPAVTIVHFDAHPDLYDNFQDNPYSHASPFARIMERKLAGHLIQIGIRTMTGHQREQVQRFGIACHEMKGAVEPDLNIHGPVYLSFDMDALDPAFAPGVSHHEPGGLSTRKAIELIHAIQGDIIGADIVEYNPKRDRDSQTAMVAAKLFREIAAKML